MGQVSRPIAGLYMSREAGSLHPHRSTRGQRAPRISSLEPYLEIAESRVDNLEAEDPRRGIRRETNKRGRDKVGS